VKSLRPLWEAYLTWRKLRRVKRHLRGLTPELQSITIARRDGPYRGPLPPYPEISRDCRLRQSGEVGRDSKA